MAFIVFIPNHMRPNFRCQTHICPNYLRHNHMQGILSGALGCGIFSRVLKPDAFGVGSRRGKAHALGAQGIIGLDKKPWDSASWKHPRAHPWKVSSERIMKHILEFFALCFFSGILSNMRKNRAELSDNIATRLRFLPEITCKTVSWGK
jgi:hypothetical protein